MHTVIGVADKPDTSTSDERWNAWIARGVEQDRTFRKRASAAAAVIVGGVGLWLAIVLLLG